jgi:hypothetical protein
MSTTIVYHRIFHELANPFGFLGERQTEAGKTNLVVDCWIAMKEMIDKARKVFVSGKVEGRGR